jgi:hypothetical protein
LLFFCFFAHGFLHWGSDDCQQQTGSNLGGLVASRKSWWLFARAGRWLMTSDELMVCPPGHQPMTDGLMFGPPAIGRWLMLPMVRPHPIGRWSMD